MKKNYYRIIIKIWFLLSVLIFCLLFYLYVDTQTLFRDRMFVSEYFKQGLGYVAFWTEEYVRTNGVVVLLIKAFSVYLFISCVLMIAFLRKYKNLSKILKESDKDN